MSWIRLHTPPKECRNRMKDLWGAKETYLFNASYKRYILTGDGIYLSNLRLLAGEIGRVESVRFIDCLSSVRVGD